MSLKPAYRTLVMVWAFFAVYACKETKELPVNSNDQITAAGILGNPDYPAISYGGYRTTSREVQPTLEELKEDLKLLAALNIKVLRTYNVHFAQAGNLLQAIRELKQNEPDFEMYVMLGAWIDCKGAWTDEPDHSEERLEFNTREIKTAVSLAKEYPEIVKVIAVGNEAMVHWAASYFVEPGVILKWVNHLQDLKKKGDLPADLWITSSDNFASWGGGDASYHKEDLEALAKAVDYVSVHTYPFHDTHYNADFWRNAMVSDSALSAEEQLQKSMKAAVAYAKDQYQSVQRYLDSIGVQKPVHIGETGWATVSDGLYGDDGSRATDEMKQALYYQYMREWTDGEGISCFFFEAFDEPWKDAANTEGSENHFGLFTVEGKAKYALWKSVDSGVFEGLTRNGNPVEKTFQGDEAELLKTVKFPEVSKSEVSEVP